MDVACTGIAAFVVLANVAGAVAAKRDKQLAIRRAGRRDIGSRVPERFFLLAGFFGGWPLTLLAFLVLQHKTRKRGFLTVFSVIAALGTLILWGWLTLLRCLPSSSSAAAP